MTAWFVSRHPGAVAWARARGIEARYVDHLDIDEVGAGDVVMGSLPVSRAAEVCARGGRYLHLDLETPHGRRGSELTPEAMERYGAKLVEFDVRKVMP